MVRRKRWKRDWHHRAPDFKLVYCGSKKHGYRNETEQTGKRRMIEVSVATDRDGAVVEKLERKKYTEKIEHWH